MLCNRCKSNALVKNGRRLGKQCFLCKDCGRQFTNDNSHLELEKRIAITLCCFGLSMRKIGWLLGYSHVTVLNWLREFENKRVTPSEDYFMDINEMCAFLSERTKNPRLGKRFPTMQEALTWNVENEMSKVMNQVLAHITLQ